MLWKILNFFSQHKSHKHVLGLGRVFNWDCNMVPGKCKFSGNKNSARLSVKHPWIQMYYSNLRQNDPKRQWATEGLSFLQSLLYCPISIKFLEHVFVPSSIRTSHLRQIHYLFDKTPVRCRWWSNTIQSNADITQKLWSTKIQSQLLYSFSNDILCVDRRSFSKFCPQNI